MARRASLEFVCVFGQDADPLRSDLKDEAIKEFGVDSVPKSKFREVLDRIKYWIFYRV